MRTFIELVERYVDPELCPYPEYKGKPYYSIKYIENGEEYVGYSTYSLRVMSGFLKKYFMSSALEKQETAKIVVGKSKGGVTLWHECGKCGEPVDAQDNFCRGCGRRLTDG